MMLTQSEIHRRVAGFERWHYELDLKGVVTPIWNPDCKNRHRQRKRYFFDPVVSFYGGSLRGKRVLDLGCNAGFWSLAAIEAGCDFVCGIDGRTMHIEQAKLVFQANDVNLSRYRFLEADLFALDWGELGHYDLVLCLGLLYHVSRPVELIDRIQRVNRDILVIDTAICPGADAVLHLRRDNQADPRNALTSSLVCVPSAAAVVEMTRDAGYHCLPLEPRFDDYTAAEDFRDGSRLAFVCAKQSDLAPLASYARVSPLGGAT